MANLMLYQYDITVLDELRSSSENDRQSENIVIEIRETDGTAPTLYADRHGNTSFTNPSVINTSFLKHTFYSASASLRFGVYDYGDHNGDTNHALRIGRYAHGVMAYNDSKVVVLPRWGAQPRLIRVPFLATGTDASDTPSTWDNAEAKAVLVNGSSENIVLPKGFVVEDVILEVRTADSGETIECGFDEAVDTEAGGDLNGFLNGASLGTAGFVVPQGDVTLGSNADYWATSTLGAYLANFTAGADTNAASLGEYVRRVHVCDGVAKTVTVKGSAAIDTAEGIIWIKGYMLPCIGETLYDLV